MLKKYLKFIIAFAVVAAILIAAGVCTAVWGTRIIDCPECDETTFAVCEECGADGLIEADSNLYSTFWSLMPPVIAIFLALITKEVYASLFIGILAGGFFYANFNPIGAWDAIVTDGFIASVADSWNAGIFIFLVILGIMVALINSSGGAAAFGRWATKNIKSRIGALLATFVLGVLIFVDDYFNCLTVGSVMTPVTDRQKISRAKLAYIIDATAAPVCMIAPISSWAAAVSSVAAETDGIYSGIELFIRAIPYNFYSLLTFVFVIAIVLLGLDYGPMKLAEMNAMVNGDLGGIDAKDDAPVESKKSSILDLLIPIIVLIVFCVAGMLYVGGIGTDVLNDLGEVVGKKGLIDAFGDTDASVGLPYGALVALLFTMVYLVARGVITFKQAMECVPKGFIAMVPALLILTFALTLKSTTSSLGADVYVRDLVYGAAPALKSLLPAIIFIVACFLAFSTGTSWGTFGILIPIVTEIFEPTSALFIIGISACLAGAVCGDHCSPISDTTIMASAGAKCDHVNHVSTQLPYALTVAGVSFVSYIIAGFVNQIYIVLPIAVVLMIGTVIVINEITKRKNAAKETN